MNATQSVPTLLTINQAAEQLQSDPLKVARLISQNGLAATQMGSRGEFLIVPANLTAYVQAGAPGFTPPPWDSNSRWFASQDTRTSGQFPDAIMAAVESKWPDEATVQSWYLANPQASYELAIELSDVRSTILQAPPKSIMPNSPPSRYGSWGAEFIAATWRTIVARRIGSRQLFHLYDPASYRAAVDGAWTELLTQAISRTGSKIYQPREKNGQSASRPVTVRMILPLSSIATLIPKAPMEQLTF